MPFMIKILWCFLKSPRYYEKEYLMSEKARIKGFAIVGMIAVVSLLTIGGCSNGGNTATATTGSPSNAAGVSGVELYKNNCARCHADDRTGTVYGKAITLTNTTIATSTLDQLSTLIAFHRAGLHLTPEQLTALSDFLKSNETC
jgi:mono/diheme cytochrome c family protein